MIPAAVSPRVHAAMLAAVAFHEPTRAKQSELPRLWDAYVAATDDLTADEAASVRDLVSLRRMDRVCGRPVTALPEVSP